MVRVSMLWPAPLEPRLEQQPFEQRGALGGAARPHVVRQPRE